MDTERRKIIRGTFCIIRREDNKYLMRLEKSGINAGCWIFPGGDYEILKSEDRTELGIECAARETREETGITPINLKFKARIFFDNRYRIFPGKSETANFDYDGDYYFTEEYNGELKPISPDGREQKGCTYEDARKLPMHEGDIAILDYLESSPKEAIFGGVIVHEGRRLKLAKFSII
jgi:8-oxo-dGTP pyrophosphatase MutT (NUDIX family)